MFLPGKNLLPLCLSLLFTAFFLMNTGEVMAQSYLFTPAPDDQATLQTLKARLEVSFAREMAALPAAERKAFRPVYMQRHETITAKFDKQEIYTAPEAHAYLQRLLQEIVSHNPQLQNEPVACVFSRAAVPNASYLGEGLILFNMGLFGKLQNESQAAFVLCHEIAHYYLHHSEKAIQRYVSTLNSDEIQQQLHALRQKEYNKRSELEKLVQDLTFDSRRHSRDHESEADSLAVELLSHTRFDPGAALSTLALLDKADEEPVDMEASMQKIFDAPGYPFQKRWLSKRSGLLGGHAELATDSETADSLKTHPDCPVRIARITGAATRQHNPQQSANPIDSLSFARVVRLCGYETIDHLFSSCDYTGSLYHTLLSLGKRPSDPYLVTQAGKVFNALYLAQKKHIFGKVTTLPSPELPPSYNTLLQFVQNLYLEDYAAISHHYLQSFESLLQSYEPFRSTYLASQNLDR